MIEDFETEKKDRASQLGRAALIIGGGYAAYETGMSFSRMTSNRAANQQGKGGRARTGRLRKFAGETRSNTPVNPMYPTESPTISEILGLSEEVSKEQALSFQSFKLEELEGSGFKSKGVLKDRIAELEKKLEDMGFVVSREGKKNAAGRIGEIRLTASKGSARMTFPVNPVSSEGTVLMGGNLHNEFAARQILDLKKYKKTGAIETMDSDVALMEKYIDDLEDMVKKGINPRTYSQKIQDTFLFEESFTGSSLNSAVGKMRRDQAVVDAFDELTSKGRATIMKNITTKKGYRAGGAGSFAKGVFLTPEAILNRVGFGFEMSPTSYQFIREAKFDESLKPSLDFFLGEDVGVGQFKYAQVDKESFQEFLSLAAESDDFKGIAAGIGEIADEEMIMSSRRTIGISNELYNAKIDPDLVASGAMKEMLDDIAGQVGMTPKELGKVLQSPGGLASLGPEVAGNVRIDPYKTIREMDAKHDYLYSRIADLKSKGHYGETLDTYYDALQSLHEQQDAYRIFLDDADRASLDMLNMELKDVQNEFKNFKRGDLSLEEYQGGIQSYIEKLKGIRERRSEARARGVMSAMGISSENANGVKLPSNSLEQQVMNMSIAPDGRLSMSLRTNYDLDVMGKVFGGQKSTIKAKTETHTLLGAYQFFQEHGVLPSQEQAKELASQFLDVDFIGTEKIIKMSGEAAMEQRRIPNAVTSYLLNRIEGIESASDLNDLKSLGLEMTESGQWILPADMDRDAQTMIAQIQELHPDKTLEEIFSGVDMGKGIKTSEILLSSDVHASQAGIGKTGTFTERGMFYLEAQGLERSSENMVNRMLREKNVFDRFDTFTRASDLEADITAEALDKNGLSGVFNTNLSNRRAAMERLGGKDGMLTVDLGQNIDGIDKVTIFGQDILDPYVGLQVGSTTNQMTEYDRSVKELIEAAANPEFTADMMATRVKNYQKQYEKVQESLSNALLKGKVKGSMYGQAVSSLPGMNEAANELGKQMKLGDIEAPLIAMTKDDIRKKLGDDALRQAEAGELFGFVTREPIEGVHSVMPTRIAIAEDFVDSDTLNRLSGGAKSGRIWFADSEMMRQSLMIDFDKDTANVVAMTEGKAREELMNFMGIGEGIQSEAGKEFYKSAKRMRYLNPKSHATPADALSLLDDELADVLASQKYLEKGSIGTFSNEFRHIHVGLRDQLASGGSVSDFYRGEDFAHAFVENIVKAKHQSSEAILKGEALDTLLLLNGEGKFARASIEERALGLQNIFDTLNYGSKEAAEEARALAARVLESDMARKGIASGMEDMVAARMSKKLGVDAEEIMRAMAYNEVSDLGNIENILKAKVRGKDIAPDKVAELMNIFGKQGPSAGMADDAMSIAKNMFNTGAKNFMKYAVAPAAIIGLGATLMSDGPNVLKKSSKAHEDSDPPPKNMNMGQTIFAIPESKVDNIKIKGSADANTNLAYLRNKVGSRGGQFGGSFRDMRDSLDKHRLQEAIEKGY